MTAPQTPGRRPSPPIAPADRVSPDWIYREEWPAGVKEYHNKPRDYMAEIAAAQGETDDEKEPDDY